MMVNLLSVGLVLVGTLLSSIGNLLIKKGTLKYSLKKLVLTSLLWGSLVLYALSVVFYVIALWGEELSVLYPLVSTAYIWTTFFSVRYLGERMSPWKWASLFGIIIGITLIGIGS